LANTSADSAANGERAGVGILGQDPATGDEITLRDGRFGAYVQQGAGEKPKRVSLPKNIDPGEITLTQAIGLLSLPREIARHPETKEPILAGIGRFGPYVQHGKTYASIGKDDDILSIGENRAIDLIVAKESGLTGRRFGDAASAPARVLGEHPDGGKVVVKAGRYGPYVNYGKINATLPPDADATTLTLEDAVALVAAKAAGQGGDASIQGRLLGEHPTGGPVTVRAGRFGPYVNRGNTNATLKGGMSPETITLEEAIGLIEDKQGAGTRSRAKKSKRAAPKTTAKAAAAARKPAAQKSRKAMRA
jgi:DNA topoisomerase-1